MNGVNPLMACGEPPDRGWILDAGCGVRTVILGVICVTSGLKKKKKKKTAPSPTRRDKMRDWTVYDCLLLSRTGHHSNLRLVTAGSTDAFRLKCAKRFRTPSLRLASARQSRNPQSCAAAAELACADMRRSHTQTSPREPRAHHRCVPTFRSSSPPLPSSRHAHGCAPTMWPRNGFGATSLGRNLTGSPPGTTPCTAAPVITPCALSPAPPR